MKKFILPALALATAFAFAPIAGADAATLHHKHPIVHHHHVVHHKARHVVHHKKIIKKVVHHKKHSGAPKY